MVWRTVHVQQVLGQELAPKGFRPLRQHLYSEAQPDERNRLNNEKFLVLKHRLDSMRLQLGSTRIVRTALESTNVFELDGWTVIDQ